MSVQSLKLPVSNGHTLHIELAGNPEGIPVLFLHGGPGAGINGNYQWPFNLSQYRVIAFDQRGCGQSQPFGDLQHNTTQDLINDIEEIRKHLKIDNWMVFGGSWGATLALCYAIHYSECVLSLILRGVFLARKTDFDWFLQANSGAARVYPDAYQHFISQVGDASSSDEITLAFYDLFTNSDETISKKALSAWFNWEGAISKLIPDQKDACEHASNQQVKSLALLENHYLKHHCFIEENYILENAARIAHIPTYIVHGRYDMVCSVSAAYELHHQLPKSELHIIDDAGHSASEQNIRNKLINIMTQLESMN
uniref:prolyl aminopeptidase n=1 Tax=Ningiella ruwaisensis TaxID=2364274 RepID=UPI0010A00F35|nr:prolyl aminopeptidase [Ningiella ruwaisensis]